MTKSLGSTPKGERLERIRKSPNYRDGSFQNILVTKMMADDVSYPALIRKFFAKGVDRSPKQLLPSISTNLNTLSDDPILIWFGHSSYLIRIDGKNILVDPVFSRRASPFQSVGLISYQVTHPYTPLDMPDIDLLIITHDHYDHLDYNSIIGILPKVKKVCTTLGVGAHLNYWGISESMITEFDWWQKGEPLPGIHLTCTPSRHFSGRSLTRNKTLWSSFVMKTSGLNLFLGGDSGYDQPTFSAIGQQFGPFDLALLECGQYNTMWPHIHMMPEQTVQASIDLGAGVLMPVHWGKFTLSLHPWYEPIERATAAAAKSGVLLATPMIGQAMALSRPFPRAAWWESVR